VSNSTDLVNEFQGHTSELKLVPIADMQICPNAQRDYDPGHAAGGLRRDSAR
jgi:hypothetical protein